jgi:phosphoribosyl-AMP cyclohydrolase
VHSDSLNNALFGPLAQQASAGFLFLRPFQETASVFGRTHHVEIAFAKSGGLVPAIIQDDGTGDVLMLGFMNADALAETQRTGEVVFFSRSKNRLWKKGESSGHVLRVCSLRVDCDADTLLIRVQAIGPGVCHEGYRSCFFRSLEQDGTAKVIAERTYSPEQVYSQEKKR